MRTRHMEWFDPKPWGSWIRIVGLKIEWRWTVIVDGTLSAYCLGRVLTLFIDGCEFGVQLHYVFHYFLVGFKQWGDVYIIANVVLVFCSVRNSSSHHLFGHEEQEQHQQHEYCGRPSSTNTCLFTHYHACDDGRENMVVLYLLYYGRFVSMSLVVFHVANIYENELQYIGLMLLVLCT